MSILILAFGWTNGLVEVIRDVFKFSDSFLHLGTVILFILSLLKLCLDIWFALVNEIQSEQCMLFSGKVKRLCNLLYSDFPALNCWVLTKNLHINVHWKCEWTRSNLLILSCWDCMDICYNGKTYLIITNISLPLFSLPVSFFLFPSSSSYQKYA